MQRIRIDNPRAVPVAPSLDPPEPVVPATALELGAIRRLFRSPPPWSPERLGDRDLAPHADLKPAAVLVPLLSRPDGLAMLLTRRSDTLASHRGQVAFPGGRVDADDPTPIAAALREAQEEIGLDTACVEVLGTLPGYRTSTDFFITPVVGYVHPAPDLSDLRLARDEVAEAFEVPMRFLMDPSNHQRRIVSAADAAAGRAAHAFYAMPWRSAAARDGEYFIWGATAGMLRNLYRFLLAGSLLDGAAEASEARQRPLHGGTTP